MITIDCPFCHENQVRRYGKNPSGTARLRCKVCRKIWTPNPVNRALTPDKEESILRALAERNSQRGIARIFRVSRDTIRAVRKKTLPE